MARRETVVMTDDLSGEEAENVTTVEFALDGVTYEIDLDEKNANELRDVLGVYVDNGRKVSGRRQPSRQRKQAAGDGYNKETKQQIREWGRLQGRTVSERGRLPGDLVADWEKAHQGAAA